MKIPVSALVVTTIGDGTFLEPYVSGFERAGVLNRVQIIVIPDVKTPAVLFERCHRLSQRGVGVICPSLEEQDSYLTKLGISELISYNSDHRRNVGFLMALERGCDYMISIDDDNICLSGGEFLEEHAVVCQGEKEFEVIHSANGWINICDLLEVEPQNIYPRGFPYRFREQPCQATRCEERSVVHLNAGLWLEQPDLDAITWLANPARALSFRGRSVVLGEGTWSPLNTQNTALHRDAIAAFYFVRMGHSAAGMQMDRYADIFSGYFCQVCMRHLGFRVRVGTPLVNHIRNRHNYLSDLTKELPCIWLLEDVAEWLRELRLQGKSYAETYLCLAEAIDDVVDKFNGFIWSDSTRTWFHSIADDMRLWTKAIRRIGGLP